jgi:hypothetical protein
MVESQNIEGINDVDLSLNLYSSQQFEEQSPFLFDYLQNQSPKRNVEERQQMEQPSLSGFAHPGAEEQPKKDSGECQILTLTLRRTMSESVTIQTVALEMLSLTLNRPICI